MIRNGLNESTPLILVIIFFSGLLTSLGPCSLSLLPITVAYLAGFKGKQKPYQRSLIFSSGIVFSLVILGSLSGLFGKIYGQLPEGFNVLVALVAIFMGLNLLGVVKLRLPNGPNPDKWAKHIPPPLAPMAAGIAFGLAASPCTTPVLAVLLTWIAQNGTPLKGIIFLACFGSGQVMPLLLAGTVAGSIPKLLALRPISQWIPAISGVIFLTTGCLTLASRLI
ncbi:cytochrome c biogenesis CcdA family protein [Prochlorococcus marinus]|uniref:cytochrome c biogenesis CcdA family protein n=1 Tax=Prochlorococcus marinus TaxID=1219 RepID=UPI003B27E5BA